MSRLPTTHIFNLLLSIFIVILIYNQYMIFTLSSVTATNSIQVISGDLQSTLNSILPKGVPHIYGQELNVGYDDVSVSNPRLADQTIEILAQFDRSNSPNYIELSGEKLDRYINILYRKEGGIACEYCCGARSVIFENGKPACGCAHSYAMRGLTKYLIEKHGSEFTEDQILEEIGKWKTLYFPTNIAQKAIVMKEKGLEVNYITLTSNKYRDIEKGAVSGGSMVGGC